LGGEWTTRRRTITEADLSAFSGVSGDFNPLHVDHEYARAGHFGGPVVHACFVAAAAMGLGSMDVPIPATVGLIGMSWKFSQPLRAGDTIHTRWRLARKREVADRRWGLGVWEISVIDQRGDVVAEGELTRLVARRDAPVETPSRRPPRRRRRGGASTAGETETTVVLAPTPDPVPPAEPAPAAPNRRRRSPRTPDIATPQPSPLASETPPEPPPVLAGVLPAAPAPRRRRRRSGSSTGSGAAAAAALQPPPASRSSDGPPEMPTVLASFVTPPSSTSARRRRRRRSGGGGSQSSDQGSSGEVSAASRASGGPPPVVVASPPPSSPAQPAPQPRGALGRVLKRLRG